MSYSNSNIPGIIVALDGNSSCGKSTFAKKIAGALGYAYIDTGAMYRAVTLAAMEQGLFDNTHSPGKEQVVALLGSIELSLSYNNKRKRSEISLNGMMVEDRIRELDVSDHVSYISAIPEVRKKMVEYQRKLGANKRVVMDGRDIGTVVFPEAEMKIFLTAAPEVRVMRRYKELKEKGMSASLEEVRANLEKRDRIDSTRKESPLKQADDALLLDNSHMTLEEQMVWFRERFKRVTDTRDG
jgi:cytidylate kinase